MNVLDRALLWCQYHRMSAIEGLNVLALIWWGTVFLAVPRAQMERSALYIIMTRIIPIEAWIALAFGIAALKVAGVVSRCLPVLLLSAALVAAWWATIGTLIITETHTYLSPSVFFIVTAASLFRIAELTVREERENDGS